MAVGLEDFERWLRDLVRQGLAALPGREPDYWREPAARLVDAKAPGMARRVKELRRHAGHGDGWPAEVMALVGQAYLLARAFARFDDLSPDEQADVRTALGWAFAKEAVVASGESLREPMEVLGVSLLEDDRLREQRVWLRGRDSGRSALLLDFAHGQRPFETLLTPGTMVELEIVFYPSRAPLRAVLKERHGDPEPLAALSGTAVDAALGEVADRLAANPWIGRLPLGLGDVTVLHDGGRFWVADSGGRALPVHRSFAHPWTLMAVAGGHPLDVFGEWRPEGFMPLACWGDGAYHLLPCEELA